MAANAQQANQAFVSDLKTVPQWKYRKYTEEEVTAVTNWLASPAFTKEIQLGENLWENMKRLSARVGMHTHPIFEYTDYFSRIANKDVGVPLILE